MTGERTKNPWPENTDYGKLWRKGYAAGRSDAVGVMLPVLMKRWPETPPISRVDEYPTEEME